MEHFNWLDSPLVGTNLIEAGAGTGKTYTIAGLYLRLVLEQGLLPDQILVVTFTQAATNELQDRIRLRLEQARRDVQNDPDRELEKILERSGGPARALGLLDSALASFDQASIFTIHGFCLRILEEFAFETGVLFDTELVSDQTALLEEIAEDFWRQHVYGAPVELSAYILSGMDKSAPRRPQDLLRLWRAVPGPEIRIQPVYETPVLDALESFRRLRAKVAEWWPRVEQEVLELLATGDLDGRRFGGLKQGRDGTSGRSRWLAGLQNIFKQLTDGISPLFPVDKPIEQITSTYLEQHTRKNRPVPGHPFFDLCQQFRDQGKLLEQQCRKYCLYLKAQFLLRAPDMLQRRKARLNVQFFDDLLLRVQSALDSSGGSDLVQVLQKRYHAALVDEFQDTDPIQCRIFTRLFSHCLFMIGDPKQAIYGFRSADIFAYLEAANNARRRYTLVRNWRSSPKLVEAVNSLFANHPNPFVFSRIKYHQAEAAVKDRKNEERSGGRIKAGLKLWYLLPGDEMIKPVTRDKASDIILEAVAGEIVRLIDEQVCRGNHIAVLTRTNRQALLAKEVLIRHGVPSALFSSGNVFDTREAWQLFYFMAAVAEPYNNFWVKAALLTDFVRHPAALRTVNQELEQSETDEPWQEFQTANKIWRKNGFLGMFQQWMANRNVRQRLLAQPDGLRQFTNIVQLAELLHDAETRENLTAAGLVDWLAARIIEPDSASEDQQLRLESDSDNVLILTAHRSKGLEFEVVFCPFLWSEPGGTFLDALVFHDPQRNWQLVMDLDPERDSKAELAAERERLAENLRLIYVSLTRAKQSCYLAWGMISNTADSALAYLLHGSGRDESQAAPESVMERLKKIKPPEFVRDLQLLAENSRGSILVEKIPETAKDLIRRPDSVVSWKGSRVFRRSNLEVMRIASFSSLVGQMQRDEFDRPLLEEKDSSSGEDAVLADFPRGPRAGLFFHEILENMDWSRPPAADLEQLVEKHLSAYGFAPDWKPDIVRMLTRLRELPLPGFGDPFSLGRLKAGQWVNEMEFYLPLKPIVSNDLKAIFRRHGHDIADKLFGRQMEKLDFSPVQGHLRGFMDMVFEQKGRFYLVDWKSNDLGPTAENYSPDRLLKVMAEDYYFLQYSLYAVALDRYLSARVADYSYDKRFGGVIYVFLRGIAMENVPGDGFFHVRPSPDFIQDLGHNILERR